MEGQVSTDFIIVCVVLALVFSLAYSIYVQSAYSSMEAGEMISAFRVAERVASAANLVLADGNGSTATVYLEPIGQNYSLEFINRSALLTWPLSPSNRTASYPLLTSSILGAGTRYAGQNITFTNDGGDIRVS